MTTIHNLGFPRIGAQRELKFALESYWKGESSRDALKQLGAELRARQSEDQRRQNANQALAEQIAKAYEQWQRWARLNALIGSASGDVFRKIAQGYNLDLLLHILPLNNFNFVRRIQ